MTAPSTRRRTTNPPGLAAIQEAVGTAGRVDAYRTPDGPYAYKVACKTCWEHPDGGASPRKWRVKPTVDPAWLIACWNGHAATNQHKEGRG